MSISSILTFNIELHQCLYVHHAGSDAAGCTLFLSYKPGDKFISLDAPFHLAMHAGGCLKIDDKDLGILVAYCYKYSPGGDEGIKFLGSGLVWCQQMTHQAHNFHLAALARICKEKMSAFGTKISMMRQQHRASSSSSTSPPLGIQ